MLQSQLTPRYAINRPQPMENAQDIRKHQRYAINFLFSRMDHDIRSGCVSNCEADINIIPYRYQFPSNVPSWTRECFHTRGNRDSLNPSSFPRLLTQLHASQMLIPQIALRPSLLVLISWLLGSKNVKVSWAGLEVYAVIDIEAEGALLVGVGGGDVECCQCGDRVRGRLGAEDMAAGDAVLDLAGGYMVAGDSFWFESKASI
jgi:hypothetical protein